MIPFINEVREVEKKQQNYGLRTDSSRRFLWLIHQRNENNRIIAVEQTFAIDFCDPIYQRSVRSDNNIIIALEQIVAVHFCDPIYKKKKKNANNITIAVEPTFAIDFCDPIHQRNREVKTTEPSP